jgi:hypothetical protein
MNDPQELAALLRLALEANPHPVHEDVFLRLGSWFACDFPERVPDNHVIYNPICKGCLISLVAAARYAPNQLLNVAGTFAPASVVAQAVALLDDRIR